MAKLEVHLFGRFRVQRNGQSLEGLEACKIQELFSYLLLHRKTIHSREMLASLLWEDCTTAQSKKYLRQALWQLQSMLADSEICSAGDRILLVNSDWLQLNPKADLWLDVAVFEQTFALIQGVIAGDLGIQEVQAIRHAVELYTSHLLEGWYREWCIYERERFQSMLIMMLDKLTAYCERNNQYEMGLSYGLRILQYDGARERTHRQMMRIHYLAGDRTAALRQYQRCVEALAEDLGVKPERRTISLYEQICADHLENLTQSLETAQTGHTVAAATLMQALNLINQLQNLLVEIQQQA
jgi:DNA-binding SARP family transcriptional activator